MMRGGRRLSIGRKRVGVSMLPCSRAVAMTGDVRVIADTLSGGAAIEGLRLLKAFRQIEDAALRRRAVAYVEALSRR
jgi:hypothetical protein